jgi:hypothetical protein
MPTTIQSIVDTISYDLLENSVGGPGLSTGIVTNQEILDYIGEVVMDFLRQTGLIQDVFTQRLVSGTSQYPIPDRMSQPYYGFVDARIIERVDITSEYLLGRWTQKPGYPKVWHQDGLPIKTIETVPAPNFTGSVTAGVFGSFLPGSRDLSIVGSMIASKEVWLISDTLDTIPDSFTPYIVFGVLAKVFEMDGESKDEQRCLYCKSRYDEGVTVGKSILLELMEDAQMENQ